MLIIVGIECLLIDSATLSGAQPEAMTVNNGWFTQQTFAVEPQRVVQPPEWIRWSLIASGAVVLLYAFTLPRRWGGGAGGEAG